MLIPIGDTVKELKICYGVHRTCRTRLSNYLILSVCGCSVSKMNFLDYKFVWFC